MHSNDNSKGSVWRRHEWIKEDNHYWKKQKRKQVSVLTKRNLFNFQKANKLNELQVLHPPKKEIWQINKWINK